MFQGGPKKLRERETIQMRFDGPLQRVKSMRVIWDREHVPADIQVILLMP